MKFKSRVTRMDLFLKIVQSLEKIDKRGVLWMAREKVSFAITTDASDGMQVWACVDVDAMFEHFRIHSSNSDIIAFEVALADLERGLKSGQFAQQSTVSLTKKQQRPYFTINVTVQSDPVMKVVQDVPVRILQSAEMRELAEPMPQVPTVSIIMPPLTKVRAVVDRLKNVGDHLTIRANMGGRLQLLVDTDTVSVTTTFDGLQHPELEGAGPPVHDPSVVAEGKVDIRRFAKVLYSYQVSPTHVMCAIIPERMIVLYVVLDNYLYITYYLPVMSSLS